jgi:hypothetical protein
MKKLLISIATVAVTATGFAGQRFDAATWRKVETFDVPRLLKQEAAMIGRLVAVRFQYRSDKLRHLQPSWYEASIWQHDAKAKNGFSALRVIVAKNDLPAFKTITADFNSMTDLTVYGRIEKDAENNLTHVRLLGRKVVVDVAGNATVEW